MTDYTLLKLIEKLPPFESVKEPTSRAEWWRIYNILLQHGLAIKPPLEGARGE